MSAIMSVMMLYMYVRPRNGPQLLLGRKLWQGGVDKWLVATEQWTLIIVDKNYMEKCLRGGIL